MKAVAMMTPEPKYFAKLFLVIDYPCNLQQRHAYSYRARGSLRFLLPSRGKNAPMAEEIKMTNTDNIRKFWYTSPEAPRMDGAHGSSVVAEELLLILLAFFSLFCSGCGFSVDLVSCWISSTDLVMIGAEAMRP